MALALVGGAALGAAFGELFAALRNISKVIIKSKSTCKEMKEAIPSLKLSIDRTLKLLSDSDPHREPEFTKFQSQLQDGLDLFTKMENLGNLNLPGMYRYGDKILKLEKKIHDFMMTQGMANVMLDVQIINEMNRHIMNSLNRMTDDAESNALMITQGMVNVRLEVQKLEVDFNERSDRLEEMVRQVIDTVNSRMTNDAESNSLMLQHMNAHEASGSCAQVPELPKFVVGLKNVISDVKRTLLEDGVDKFGIKGMGGSGKSTLALALCKDTEVKDFFQNNIIFITVSRLGNVKALLTLLETMWDKLIGGKRPDFQSIEDAHRQLQTNLKLRPCKPTLVVLDDVWSNVEELLFEAKGYKTIITTRHDYTVPKQSSRLYELSMLQRADALSLFCFWSFGQSSIPETEDENLVKEVAGYCQGLPLALKVIGSSLRREPYLVWECAKEKLSRAEPISDNHKKDLLNLLETSIDVLDDEYLQCFMDLGAFPKGRKFSVDALLDIWVYVYEMEWHDAFMVLFELACRNLLNLTSSPGDRSNSYGCAYGLSFSQHDVMRDIALRRANKDSTGHSKRLFMPRMEDGIPRKWMAQDQSFNAQIVSIHTGAMDQKKWGQIDFLDAEALILFFDASKYYLPPRMPKLKVLLICNNNSKRTMLDGLPNLHSLSYKICSAGESDCSSSL